MQSKRPIDQRFRRGPACSAPGCPREARYAYKGRSYCFHHVQLAGAA